jgi:hypothetical protein
LERAVFLTVADYLTDTRTLLQDTVPPFRYDNASLVTALNLTLFEVRRVRPDIFLPYLDSTPQFDLPSDPNVAIEGSAQDLYTNTTDLDDSDPYGLFVPIEEQFRMAISHGIAGHAYMRDQEDIPDARATAFMKFFYKVLTGVDTTLPMPRPTQPER